MSQLPNRILVDKEKVEIDGKKAFRLYFYDVMDGDVTFVISFIKEKEVVIEKPTQEIEPVEKDYSGMEELQHAL